MVQVLGAVGGIVNVALPALKVNGVPTQTFGVEFGQSAYDITTSPPTLYTYLTSGWVVGDGSGSLDQVDTDSGTAVPAGGTLNVVGGTNIATSGAGATATVALTGQVAVANGGTGAATLTDHGVLLGQGTSAVVATAVAADGQLLIGATGADPAPASVTSTDGSVTITEGPNTLDLSANTAISQALLFREVTLTSTEVKALATTPITLVSAPAAGSVVQFMGATLKLNYGGTNVFTEAGDNLGIKYTDAAGVQVCTTIEMTGFIDQAADTYTNAVPSADAIVAATGAEAQALVLDNLGSNFAGNAADDNTLTVRVYYTVQALA